MNRKFFVLALALALTILGGCAPYRPTQTMNGGQPGPTRVFMHPVTYIVPLDDGLIHQQGLIEDLVFADIGKNGYGTQKTTSGLLGTMTISNYRDDAIDSIFSKLISEKEMIVERRLALRSNPSIGSGTRYYLNYTKIKTPTEYKVTLQPTKSETYQDKIILPMPVPPLTENNLSQYLMALMIYYRFEVNSEFNSESVHSNFIRLLQVRDINGETDPVTGKIFKQQFILPYRGRNVLFTLETFPYRNGSKAVMYLRVPAMLTSANTVDFKILLDEIKNQLKAVVQS